MIQHLYTSPRLSLPFFFFSELVHHTCLYYNSVFDTLHHNWKCHFISLPDSEILKDRIHVLLIFLSPDPGTQHVLNTCLFE